MKSLLLDVCLVFMLFSSCGKTVKVNPESVSDTVILKEYFSNGKIKSEVSAIRDLRQGRTRNYDQQGRLLSEVYYVNNVKEGVAKNYYPKTGKLNSTIEYKNGVKQGNEIWYYENGQKYRVSPYVDGILDGIRKMYYSNGNLMAEIPFKGGSPGTGLKEYKTDGTLIKGYPRIVIHSEDHLREANKILLIISLSNNTEAVKFYKGPLLAGRYLHTNMLLMATQNGISQIDFNIPPGSAVNQATTITAALKTRMGNTLVISTKYNLQVVNRQ